MSTRLLVFGGNGFLGQRICEAAVKNGFQVTSLSRSGQPPKSYSRSDSQWIRKVNWQSADIFNPNTYKQHLKDTPNVVHSIGILLENESYKGILSNPFSIFQRESNPLLQPRYTNPNFTYYKMNTESALILADTFKKALKDNKNLQKKPTFTYISADQSFPVIPRGYIDSKRNTESELLKMREYFRPILMRPGFMFDESTSGMFSLRSCIGDILSLLNCANKGILNKKSKIVNEIIRSPVSTSQVGRCVIENIKNEKFYGIAPLEYIINS